MNEMLMATWLVLFGFGVLAQMYAPLKYTTKAPNIYGAFLSFMLIGSSIGVAWWAFAPWTAAVISIISVYLTFNAWLLALWKFHSLRTRNTVIRSARFLTTALLFYSAGEYFGIFTELNFAIALICLALYANVKVARTRHRGQMLRLDDEGKSAIPTVALAIPARNETHALTQQLKTVTQSAYPKLEILVADDCSHDDTAQIIRSFAHDGVRFVKGVTPAESWVGKNQTYELLSEAASADYILFSGVDTRYDDDTITHLIRHMVINKLEMVSVLPQHKKLVNFSLIVQPIRYLMVLLLSTDKQPEVLSTVWAIKASTLKKLGGFQAVENSIVPETYFAKQIAATGKYQFVVAPEWLGLSTFKKPSSQRETAIRYLYPRMRRTVGYHLLFVAVIALVTILPLVSLVNAIISGSSLATVLSFVGFGLLVVAHGQLLSLSYPSRTLWRTPFVLYSGLLTMFWLSLQSIIGYELDRIMWKGRNVCYPVMLDSLNPHK